MGRASRLVGLTALCFAALLTTTAADTTPVTDACLEWFAGNGMAAAGRPGVFALASNRTACFDGTIEKNAADGAPGTDALIGWATSARRIEGDLLVMRSHGGDAARSIEITEALQANGVQVVVSEVCASACANYFYAAVPDRHVIDGTIILFHGGPSAVTRAELSALLDEAIEQRSTMSEALGKVRTATLRSFDDLIARSDALLERAGASTAIVHNVDALDLDALPARACGGDHGLPREFTYFGPEHAIVLGIAPVSGRPLTDPSLVNAEMVRRKKEGKRVAACLAPESLR